MPEKLDSYRSYGQKLIGLFAKMLFTGRSYSLIELSRTLDCSKQTVLRLIDDVRLSYGVEIDEWIENRKKYYKMRRLGPSALLALTESEIAILEMCRVFAEHLLGKTLIQEAIQGLEKNQAHLTPDKRIDPSHFSSIIPGTIDYTPFHETISKIIKAMNEKRVCKIAYTRMGKKRSKQLFIKPFKLFSHKETVYLHARMAKHPGKRYIEPKFDPILAVHRIHAVEVLSDRRFEIPTDYNFEKSFNQNFGVIKGEAFKVTVRFTGWAADFVSERTWSLNQKLVRSRDGGIKLTFSASSEPEVISWILSFGEYAELMKPLRLRNDLANKVKIISECYGSI